MSQTSKQSPTRKLTGRRIIGILLGVFMLLILAWGVHLGWHTVHLLGLARGLQDDPTQIQLETLGPLVRAAAGDLSAIRQDLAPLFPVFNALQGMPEIGAYLSQIEPLVNYGNGLAQAGKEITLGVEPLLQEPPAGQIQLSLNEHLSQVLQSGQSHFVDAAREVSRARQARGRIRPELLPDSLRPPYLQLDERIDLFLAGVQALQAAPQLLGAGQVQSYLILAQNRDELRATGGFISGIGLLTIQDGKILHFELEDSYTVDDFVKPYPKPPEPLERFMLADYWVTRDANWSPDFPTAAQHAQALYTLSTGVETQGVIAFNQLTVRRILEVIGPLQVPGTNELVTAMNVEDYMRQAWAPALEEGLSQDWWEHRKDFMQQLGSVILDEALKAGNQERLLDLAGTIVDLLGQGQLLLYFNDPSTQAVFEAGGWDGAIQPGRSDYLYLVDSNVGFNKVDSVIQRSLDYTVDLHDLHRPTGIVTITYQHMGSGDPACKQAVSYGNGTYQDMQQRCYLDYWRVYVPGGSDLLAGNAQSVPADELLNGLGWSGQVENLAAESGTQVLAGLLMLSPAQSSHITISYSLPPNVIQLRGKQIWGYTLHIQVQPGLEGLPFRLKVVIPTFANLLDPGEGWQSLAADTWVWQGVLDRSTSLSLSIQTHPDS